MDDYLSKPFSETALLALLSRTVAARPPARSVLATPAVARDCAPA